MSRLTKIQPGATIADPACGTGGFFLSAHDHIVEQYGKAMDRDQMRALKEKTFRGWEIVDNTARLCTVNLFLHGIGGAEPVVTVADALLSLPG